MHTYLDTRRRRRAAAAEGTGAEVVLRNRMSLVGVDGKLYVQELMQKALTLTSSLSLASTPNSRMGFNLFKKPKPNFKLAHKKQTNMFPAISFTVGNFGQQQQQQRKREWAREFRPLAAYQKKTRSRSVTLFAGGGRDSLGTRSNLKVQLNKSLNLSRPPTPFESVSNLMDYASKYWHLFRRVGTLHSLVYFGLLAGEIKLITPSGGEC